MFEDKENMIIKVTDFGFATYFEKDAKENLVLGSPYYMAPEIIQKKGYDNKVDVWAIGIIVYEMLCGLPPFDVESGEIQDLYQEIVNT